MPSPPHPTELGQRGIKTDLGSWWQTEPNCLLWPARSGALGCKGHFTHTASVDCGRTQSTPSQSPPLDQCSQQETGIKTKATETLTLAHSPWHWNFTPETCKHVGALLKGAQQNS